MIPMSRLSLLILSLLMLNSCSDREEGGGEEITIGVAASLGPLFSALADAFERDHPEYAITISTAGSNVLARQARAGIPFDLIALASTSLIDTLESVGIVRSGTTTTFAGNRLVLIQTSRSNSLRIESLADLLDPRIERIAIASAGVPAGDYAREVLETSRLLDTLKPRFIYGGNVRAVLVWVERGEATCGFVYETDVTDADVSLALRIESSLHTPIAYTIGVIDGGEEFVEFLKSEEGRRIVEKFGFSPN